MQSKTLYESVNDVLIHSDRKMTLFYSYEELEPETLAWRAIEMVPDKAHLDELLRTPSSRQVVVPARSPITKLIILNPKSERLSGVVIVKQGHVLVFVETIDRSCLQLYRYARLGQNNINLIKTFKRGLDLWAFDELSRLLAMYDKNTGSIKTFRFDESYQHMEWTGGDIQLSNFSGSRNIMWMELVPGKREILLVDDENRLRMCEVVSSMMRAKHVTLPETIVKACVTPDASCLIVISLQKISETRQMGENANKEHEHSYDGSSSSKMSAYVFLLDDSLTFLKCLPLDAIDELSMEQLHVVCKCFGTQMQLVFLSSRVQRTALISYVIEISSAQQTLQLQKVGIPLKTSLSEHSSEQNSQSTVNLALEYIFHVFDKYSISPPLCFTERNLCLCVLLNPPHRQWENSRAKKNCEDLFAFSIRKLKKKGKLFKLLRHLSIESLENTSQLEQSIAVKNTSEMGVGAWIQKLLCLVPLQIARAENNTLKPMINGLQIPANATYIDAVSLASLLRFGPYDFMLTGWKGQVKVISSMGKQSSGKSYLLNHLAGNLLDVAGGRCTDGVWMTIRYEPDCLYVLLDFEGLGSFERSEQEDMFLSLLNAAISNITIFNKKVK